MSAVATVLAPCRDCPAGDAPCRCEQRAAAVPEPTPVDLDAEIEAVTSS